MKLHKSLLIFGASALLLAACGDDSGNTEEETAEEPEVADVVEDENADETEVVEEEATEDDGGNTSEQEVTESEIGVLTNVSGNLQVDESIENGPFTVTVVQARASQLQPADDYVDMFGGEDLAMVSFDIEVANDSEDTNSIYPNQAILVTDTGAQIDADLLMSDDVGGDFYGEVTKSGAVHFIFDGNAEEIQSARYIIDSGSDESFERFGEDIEFTVEF